MTKLLPIWSIPYTQYVNKKLPSIVWEFKNNWYSTKAIHTFEKKFFNRNNAYPFLWFDKFIAVEDMEYPTFKWPFVSDDYFVNEIIYNLKTFQDKPNFIFGISMQNHFSYEWEKYKKDEINVEVNSDKLLSEKNRKILTNYTQWISDADKSLEKLISYLKSREKPTIVLFFWDHLGTMWDNYETYRETWYIKSKSTEKLSIDEISSIHLTPFLIWDNLWIKKQNLEKIPAYYLWNHLLDYFNFNKKSRYFENMDYLYKDYLKNPWNNDLLKKHHLLQYDMFFWENFLEKIWY
ncbi:MAG: sulfatase [uncultured bacterium (gcode 4)]|uniref:Sulfatase n=1 Tax=uncultured bacterium (gcode 4) TaxID=1234023 RepID=K2FWD0_9BACT|nr:MAG: sulfatase [uncultured bacterium (gcode 4)]